MAPTESRISSVEEKRSEATTSSTTSATSSFNATTKSSSHVRVSGNHTSLLDSGDDTQVTLPITSRSHFCHDSFFDGVRQKSDVFGLESLNNKNCNLKVSEDLSKVSHDSSFEDFLFGDKCLPIAPKGLFFSDSFFQDVRRDFETAVSEVLTRHGLTNTVDDQLSCYRSLRERELSDKTQAMRTTEDDNEFKVVMDVQDFKKEDIKVKVEDEREVVVEGHVEKKDGGFWSTRSFCRRFNVPCEVDMKAIASAMSSDGVLTITVPKMKKRIQNSN